MGVPIDQVSEAMARMGNLLDGPGGATSEQAHCVRVNVDDLNRVLTELVHLRAQVTDLQTAGTALQTENRALSKKLKESIADDPVLTWIRDLVRAAELLEQRDPHGKIWDDSARRGLEAARERGWGNHQIGSLLGPGDP